MKEYDFCGWATKHDLECSDGRIIRKNAFQHNDGEQVPLVWNHGHNDISNVLGHAILSNRDEGVYAYGYLNDTESGQSAKKALQHGDIHSLSIYANRIKEYNNEVVDGQIKELSLVLAGANPGAFVDFVVEHDDQNGKALTAGYYQPLEQIEVGEDVKHSDKKEATIKEDTKETKEPPASADKEYGTVGDVFDSFDPTQKEVVLSIIGSLLEQNEQHQGGNEDMKHNVFEDGNVMNGADMQEGLSHSDIQTIIKDGKRFGSLKESILQHADDYGIRDIDMLFPDYKNITNEPQFLKRRTEWVSNVMNSIHHSPFSRIKSLFADIREDEARAKGYIKGNLKKEEVFSLLKRTTSPTTVYKKQKLDRDDVNDITDFNVVTWLKAEMRLMLEEELARAFLIGDGRLPSSDDKISQDCIRPVWTDADLFTLKYEMDFDESATPDTRAKEFIRKVLKSRKDYKGSGSPVLYTTEDMISDMLLLEDQIGRRLYNTVDDLKTVLRVSNIVPVEVMENQKRDVFGKDYTLMGIIVNMADYNVGTDKGGEVSMFDDFDIDYNQMKYLMETRCSGALIKPFSAMVYEYNQR